MLSVIETCPKGIGKRPRIDISGQQFGMLVAMYFSHVSEKGNHYWACRCECGVEKKIPSSSLRKAYPSCGCRRDGMLKNGMMHRTHGMAKSTEFHIYNSMVQRCTNPNSHAYGDYGGRGIYVCERWLESFENFFADMGSRPQGTSLDRRDNNLGYCPENCRWATKHEQANNTRANRVIEFRGERMTMSQWARKSNLQIQTLHNRLLLGWTVERALTTPSRKSRKQREAVNS